MRVTKSRIRRAILPTMSELEEKRNSQVLERVRGILDGGAYAKRDGQLDVLLESGHSATDIASALWQLLEGETGREPQKILEDDPRQSQGQGPRKPYPKYAPREGGGGGGGGGGGRPFPYRKPAGGGGGGAPYRKDRGPRPDR